MSDFFSRQSIAFQNDLRRSMGALLGIAQGLICDKSLNDDEVRFLNAWLNENENISLVWPGDVVHMRVRAVLADGVITDEERVYLLDTLQRMVGRTLEDLDEAAHVSEMMFDPDPGVSFAGRNFCLTGDFVFAPRKTCAAAIERRGGLVASGVSHKLHYLVVGGLGSAEWKHGSFGTKVEKAMALKKEGATLRVVREDAWAQALSSHPV